MTGWWGRSVAACSSVAVLAGLVATAAAAVDADRVPEPATTVALPPPPTPVVLAAPLDGRPRAGDGSADVAVPVGWRDVATQRVVPVTPGRYDTVVATGDRAVVLVGRAATTTPRRGTAPPDPADLAAEARRLAASSVTALMPGARAVPVADAADTVGGRPAWTTVARVPAGRTGSGAARGAGALVRVSVVATTPGAPAAVLLAVALAGPDQPATARTTDDVVRSLRLGPPAG